MGPSIMQVHQPEQFLANCGDGEVVLPLSRWMAVTWKQFTQRDIKRWCVERWATITLAVLGYFKEKLAVNSSRFAVKC